MIDHALNKTKFKGPIFHMEEMSRHTSFRIGGPADIFCIPQSIEDLQVALDYAQTEGIPYFIMGNGTNLLVSDKGFRGMVIKISGVFNGLTFNENRVTSGAGTNLDYLIMQAASRGLFGLPFAVGIPGTVAGAVVMNAGSSTQYMGQHVQRVRVLDCYSAEIKEMKPEDLIFCYRKSILDSGNFVVLDVELLLDRDEPERIYSRIAELRRRRKEVQPLDYPSAGSVFRNPPQLYAGKLIEDAGCKGWTIGGAMVSPLHANFIINFDKAKAEEIATLMLKIRQKVLDQFGILLEPEIKILGEWDSRFTELLRNSG